MLFLLKVLFFFYWKFTTSGSCGKDFLRTWLFTLFLFFSANQDFTIRGYTIPKGAEIVANLWALHNDPKYWDEPEVFRPERFLLNGETTLLKFPESYAPFSIGKGIRNPVWAPDRLRTSKPWGECDLVLFQGSLCPWALLYVLFSRLP